MTIENAQKDIVDNFLFFDDWTQKYEYIIELSKDLESMNESLKNEDNLIKGCQSKVWLHAEMINGKINFLADSEAIITKGIISILLNVFNNRKPQEILDSDMGFIEKILSSVKLLKLISCFGNVSFRELFCTAIFGSLTVVIESL